jgi:hypothetical protein
MNATLRLAGIVLLGAIAIAVGQVVARDRAAASGALTTSDGDTVDVTPEQRARGLVFAPAVHPSDRAWIRAAIARARPEAARLIAEVDGLVTVGTFAAGGQVLGVTRGDMNGFTIDFDVSRLDHDRVVDRTTVVLHELGHVVDFALVPATINADLDAQIPRDGLCGRVINCDAPPERFADTFAKWAVRGAVSEVGAGYGVPMPPSLETWGQPLSRLAFTLPR